jgi:hypothetical protein
MPVLKPLPHRFPRANLFGELVRIAWTLAFADSHDPDSRARLRLSSAISWAY